MSTLHVAVALEAQEGHRGTVVGGYLPSACGSHSLDLSAAAHKVLCWPGAILVCLVFANTPIWSCRPFVLSSGVDTPVGAINNLVP